MIFNKTKICLESVIKINLIPVRFCKFVKKFPVVNKIQQFDAKHIPDHLFDDLYKKPRELCDLGVRYPGIWFKKHFKYIKEMEPELIVPDLEGFQLKPYVSYKNTDGIVQEEFTARDLFNAVYADKFISDAVSGEKLEVNFTYDNILDAKLKAMRTGSDLYEPSEEELNSDKNN